MTAMRGVWMVLAVALLAACAGLPQSAQTPLTSDNDGRAYRYLRLDNGLRVLLISDAGAQKAGASLDVNIGSRQDPPGREGLAHFLEHMLFLGTEKYPRADEYQEFISAHGGGHNAYTAFEHTNYFFDVDPDYLAPALDRFAQFFVAPLFTADYVAREKNAVNAEYLARIKDEQRRSLEVLKAQVNPDHPFAKFTVGDLTTLADKPGHTVRDDLIDFYRRYYSANLMTLVVLGPQSLDALETMVRPDFSRVPNHDVQLEPIAEPLFNTEPERLITVRPEQEQRQLTLMWPVDDPQPHYHSKPAEYLGNLLGHEGEGSLLSFLKAQGWASGLAAGLGLAYDGGATFAITVQLTEAGVDAVPAVVDAVYHTIDLIAEHGIEAWRFDEQARIAEQTFRFQERGGAIDEVSGLARDMHLFPVRDVLRGHYLMDRYDPGLIADYLARLRPDTALMLLVAPDVPVSHRTARYAVAWGEQPLGQPVAEGAAMATIQLPEPNPFIAHRLALIDTAAAPGQPEQVRQKPGFNAWYLPDTRFQVPRGNLFVAVRSPLTRQSPREAAAAELAVRLIREQLNEFAYPAMLAGLDYSVDSDTRGYVLRIGGFDDRQPVLLKELLAAFVAPDTDAAQFERVHADYLQALENSVKRPPFRRLLGDLQSWLVEGEFSNEALLVAARELDPATVLGVHRQILAAVDLQILLHGNYDREASAQLLGQIQRALLSPAHIAAVPEVSIAHLAAGDVRHLALGDHPDTGMVMYLQSAQADKHSRAAIGLAAQILGADYYNALRTERQLGYVVTAAPYPLWDVPGLIFVVQSPVAGVAELQEATRGFLRDWLAQPPDVDRYQRHRDALVQRLQEQPRNLDESSARYWQDLTTGHMHFDSRAQLVAQLSALDRDAWWALVKRDLGEATGRRLWLMAASEPPGMPAEGEAAAGAQVFKADLPAYHFP